MCVIITHMLVLHLVYWGAFDVVCLYCVLALHVVYWGAFDVVCLYCVLVLHLVYWGVFGGVAGWLYWLHCAPVVGDVGRLGASRLPRHPGRFRRQPWLVPEHDPHQSFRKCRWKCCGADTGTAVGQRASGELWTPGRLWQGVAHFSVRSDRWGRQGRTLRQWGWETDIWTASSHRRGDARLRTWHTGGSRRYPYRGMTQPPEPHHTACAIIPPCHPAMARTGLSSPLPHTMSAATRHAFYYLCYPYTWKDSDHALTSQERCRSDDGSMLGDWQKRWLAV